MNMMGVILFLNFITFVFLREIGKQYEKKI